jgi:hypothetical protein
LLAEIVEGINGTFKFEISNNEYPTVILFLTLPPSVLNSCLLLFQTVTTSSGILAVGVEKRK